ncbi:MAG: Gfo/Idh/MocA family oxidoreductase [Bacteroidales bacterium]|nr:Gfo/Idh/MocA family oxidoreductase [Bacteroidales bacterium]
MTKQNTSRREFLQKSAFAAAAITIIPRHVLGGKGFIAPSDVIALGVIGTGKLATGYYKNFAKLPGVRIIAASDVDNKKLKRFQDNLNTYYSENVDSGGDPLKTFENYHELLAFEEIDAVLICTPDHWHALQSIDAMKAGKDVYCEKPLAHTLYEGKKMVETSKKTGKIVQTGSMQRSWRDFRHACELVQNGYVGEISKVLVSIGDPEKTCDLPGEPVPDYLNWDAWVGPAQMHEYSPVLSPPIEATGWPRWRDYREFGGGILCDWGAHMFDIAQWGLGMDNTGPVKIIPPEASNAVRGLKMIYANGIEVVHENFNRGWGVRFIGSEGTLDISRSYLDSKPEKIAVTELKSGDKRLYFSDNHYQDWIDAIKKRSQPITNVEVGHRSASLCNIANIAYRLNRTLEWDPVREKFKGDGEANKQRTKKYRKPYKL